MKIRNIQKIKNRIKLWNIFKWGFPGTGKGFFNRNHSLNLGVEYDKRKTFERRLTNKKNRLKNKREMNKIKKQFL